MPAVPRDECLRCFRPRSHCHCPDFEALPTQTRVVFLQHPREARVAIGTARMAHLALSNSELHEGVSFEGHARVAELVAQEGTALLFPGEGATPIEALRTPPKTLLVLDGTWPQARILLRENPGFQSLPRIGFVPRRPGNYRIRREPEAHCLATIEAVVEVLGAFEGGTARFQPLIEAFERMVDQQLEAAAARVGPPRRRLGVRPPWFRNSLLVELAAGRGSLVVVAAEANVHRKGSDVPGAPELVHLVARRVGTDAGFEAILRPRRPLASGVPSHLGLDAALLIHGEPAAEALARFKAFLRSEDRFAGWGPGARDLLASEGVALAPWLDMRQLASVKLKGRPGALEAVARKFGPALPEFGSGRAGRACADLLAIAGAMLAEAAGAKREELHSRRELGLRGRARES